HIKLTNQSETSSAEQSGQPSAAGNGIPAITSIAFHRGGQGAGRIIVDTTHFDAPVDVSRAGNKVIAIFPGAKLSKKLEQQLNVLDFATPVKYVDAFATSKGAKVVVTPTRGAQFK